MLGNSSKPLYAHLLSNIRENKSNSELSVSQVMQQISKLKQLKGHGLDSNQISEKLSALKHKLKKLREQMKNTNQSNDQVYSQCRKRVQLSEDINLQKIEQFSFGQKEQQIQEEQLPAEPSNHPQVQIIVQQQQNQTAILHQNFQKQILHYLYCIYEPEVAQQFLEKINNANYRPENLEEHQLTILKDGLQISEKILKNQLKRLKNWCRNHSNFLEKIKSPLQFHVLICEYIDQINYETQKVPSNRASLTHCVQILRKSISKLSLSQQQTTQITKLTMLLLQSDMRSEQEIISEEKDKNSQIKNSRFLWKFHNEKDKNQSENKSNQAVPFVESEGSEDERGAFTDFLNFIQERADINTLQFFPARITNLIRQRSRRYERNSIRLPKKQLPFQLKYLKQKNWKQRESLACNVINRNKIREYLIKTNQRFIEAFETIYQIPLCSMLDRTIQFGVMTLKNGSCQNKFHPKKESQIKEPHPYENQQKQKKQCPICTKQGFALSWRTPNLTSDKTILICRINGSIMDDSGNEPIMLPNGQIYSYTGLESTLKNGKYYCVQSRKGFRKESCKKIFLC